MPMVDEMNHKNKDGQMCLRSMESEVVATLNLYNDAVTVDAIEGEKGEL